MSWRYQQATGQMWKPDGTPFCVGFSGRNDGLNRGIFQDRHNVGPIPIGKYKMKAYFPTHPNVGTCAIELDPDPANEMYGRSGFFIHGLNIMNPLQSSEGCIVLGSGYTRVTIWQSLDHDLEVTL